MLWYGVTTTLIIVSTLRCFIAIYETQVKQFGWIVNFVVATRRRILRWFSAYSDNSMWQRIHSSEMDWRACLPHYLDYVDLSCISFESHCLFISAKDYHLQLYVNRTYIHSLLSSMKSNFNTHSFSFLDKRQLIICAMRNTLVAGNDLLLFFYLLNVSKFQSHATNFIIMIENNNNNKENCMFRLHLRITSFLKLFDLRDMWSFFSAAKFILISEKSLKASIYNIFLDEKILKII